MQLIHNKHAFRISMRCLGFLDNAPRQFIWVCKKTICLIFNKIQLFIVSDAEEERV